mmetsp:Transcript_27669/g.94435  ORF Transcript_27669/g.94435 Transcript_27669/m.94435 type:complete len:490 (-) Transcript_27669:114-1583(-)
MRPPTPPHAGARRVYTRAEVSSHTSESTGVWVTYKDGVYDITDFVRNHPGGSDKIMLAAGGAVDPFWNLYRQHLNTPAPLEMLEQMRVGDLDPKEYAAERAAAAEAAAGRGDPYAKDPARHPALVQHSRQPCLAETPRALLAESYVTPSDLWYVRNHHPVPVVGAEDYRLEVSGAGVSAASFSLDDLRSRFPRREVTATIQCGGNRRGGIDAAGPKTSGTAWGAGAVSTATFAGAPLRDVLQSLGLDVDEPERRGVHHVHAEALDTMRASIPADKATGRRGDVILAYEMNGEPLPRDHGYPVRLVVPGHVGVRNVKWVGKVVCAAEEADGPWQRGLAYKGFGPGVRAVDGIDVEGIQSVQEQPVQSVVVSPGPGQVVEDDGTGKVDVRGFAYSGGGRGIVRVDVSADGGETWHTAELKDGSKQPAGRAWAWTLFEAAVPLPEGAARAEICCKATDASYNVQPERAEPIWNLRGLNNNSWHRVPVTVDRS